MMVELNVNVNEDENENEYGMEGIWQWKRCIKMDKDGRVHCVRWFELSRHFIHLASFAVCTHSFTPLSLSVQSVSHYVYCMNIYDDKTLS